VVKIFKVLRRAAAKATPHPTAVGKAGGIAMTNKLRVLLIIVFVL